MHNHSAVDWRPVLWQADVFSFGVVLYETFARTLLLFTKIGNGQ